MISRRLIRTDLNLLVALQILLEERNVTRAAERLSVSQPALSKTLQKLRDSFEDALFTRTLCLFVTKMNDLGGLLSSLGAHSFHDALEKTKKVARTRKRIVCTSMHQNDETRGCVLAP